MITDIFKHRYDGVLGFHEHHATHIFSPIFMQAAHIFFEDLRAALKLEDGFFCAVNQQLARELGLPALSFDRDEKGFPTSAAYLAKPYDLWSDAHGGADYFCKTRLSMLELLFRRAEEHVLRMAKDARANPGLFALMTKSSRSTELAEAASTEVRKAIDELNARLRAGQADLVYHNGLIQIAAGSLTNERIARPFWDLVADKKWGAVDREMKEAIDRLDHRQTDAVLYAAKALESTVKIISDERGWSTGSERGAIAYIDNLRSERSRRFIEAWEAEALAVIFRHIRNPHSHGGGSAPPLPLSSAQQTWVVDNCMAWIKSLIRRTSGSTT